MGRRAQQPHRKGGAPGTPKPEDGKPDAPVGFTYADDGRLIIAPDKNPWRDLSKGERIRRLRGVLELAAAAGDVRAAKEALDFHRWETEMKRGRPAQRVDGAGIQIGIQVLDDLGRPRSFARPEPQALVVAPSDNEAKAQKD